MCVVVSHPVWSGLVLYGIYSWRERCSRKGKYVINSRLQIVKLFVLLIHCRVRVRVRVRVGVRRLGFGLGGSGSGLGLGSRVRVKVKVRVRVRVRHGLGLKDKTRQGTA